MAGRSDSLVRKAVLAEVVLSYVPRTRLGYANGFGERFGDLVSWDDSHIYGHFDVLARQRLVVPLNKRKKPPYRASAEGVEEWRRQLRGPIDPNQPVRDAMMRLRSCRRDDLATMLAIVDLCEEQLEGTFEEPVAVEDESPFAFRLTRTGIRMRTVAELRWCQRARDEIRALATLSAES